MPVANQYGIDMGNILSTVSDLKTAQQNRETNALQKDILSRQNTKEIATDQAEQDYLKDPKTAVAQTIAQKMQWNKLGDEEKVRAATAMKQHINQRGIALNSIIGIQDPVAQKEALLKTVSTLTPEEQEGMSKYGNSVEEWQQNLPHMMNDLLVSDGGVDMLQKQAEAKTKHEGDLETKGMELGNTYAIEMAKEKARKEDKAAEYGFRAKEGELNRGNVLKAIKVRAETPPVAKPLDPLHRDMFEYRKKHDSEVIQQRREKQADTVIPAIDNYDELPPQQQALAKKFYKETGEVPKVVKGPNGYQLGRTKASSNALPPLPNRLPSERPTQVSSKQQLIDVMNQKGMSQDQQKAYLKTKGF